jgi:hypothetical protein
MRYTLLMPNGRIMLFYIESVANLYQRLHGGVVITQQVLEGLDTNAECDIMVTY